MASPTVVAETPSNDDNATTSFTISTGSPLEGEGVVIFLSRDNGGTGTVSWSDGYTELYDVNDDDGFSSASAAYKQAGASEPSSITVTSTVSGEFTARAYRVSGHLSFATQAPDFGIVTDGGNTVTHDPPSVNVTGGAADILSLVALPFDTHNSNVNTYPSSYINTGVTRSGVSGSQCSLAFCTRAITSVSSEDPGAFTLSATRRGIPTTVLIQAEAAAGNTITADVDEAGDTTSAALEVVVSVSADVTEAGDTTAATLENIVSISADVAEDGDATTAALDNIVSISANVAEAGDTTAATLDNIVSISANVAEAGDVTAASITVGDVPAQITANVAEAGDTAAAALNNIVSITANQNEAGDTTAASINVVGVAQITANINEAGDVTAATLNNIVSITANQLEAGDATAASILSGQLVAANAKVDIFPAFAAKSDINPAYLAKVDIL